MNKKIVPVLLALLATPVSLRADASAPARDYDRFDIRVGGGWVFGANTDMTATGKRGFGTVVDYANTLGGSTTDSLFRVEGTWHMAEKHALNFTWYDVKRSGTRVLDQDINFGNQDFPVGLNLNSTLDIGMYRLLYRYGIARTDQVDLDLGAGLYVASIKAALSAASTIGTVASGTTEDGVITAPLPTADLLLKCKLTQKLSLMINADLFYFSYNQWQGSQTDLQTGLEYNLARHWTLGAAYERLNINLDGPAGSGTFSVNNSWNVLYSYLAFHW